MKKLTLAVIGSGPAGYTSAIYSSRDLIPTTVIAGGKSGGQLMYTTEVENFPGFAEGKNGPQLMIEMRKQAERFGAEMVNEYVTAVDFSQRPFKLWTHLPTGEQFETLEQGSPEAVEALLTKTKQEPHDYEAEAIIVSTGAVSRMLSIPGEKELLGRGVSTCAVCDAAFFRDKVVAVAGGGDSAMEDTLALTKFATKVYLIHRRDSFKASKIMQERVLNHPKVEVIWNTEIIAVNGEQSVESITLKTGEETKELPVQGFFLAIGHIPMTKLFVGQLTLDSHGYVVTRQSVTKQGVELAQAALTDENLVAFPTMTSVEGVFAAGDVVDVRYKQAVTAAGQGCAAALDAERWLER